MRKAGRQLEQSRDSVDLTHSKACVPEKDRVWNTRPKLNQPQGMLMTYLHGVNYLVGVLKILVWDKTPSL